MSTPLSSNSAATDVGEFFSDLDAGVFERQLSVALSKVAAATTDHDKVGEVNIKLTFKKIAGTSQVNCSHELKFTQPTSDGKAGEQLKRATVLHVGKYGRLSLIPDNQTALFDTKQHTQV
jgi:hypothetical protein